MHHGREHTCKPTLFWRAWSILSLTLGWFAVLNSRSQVHAFSIMSQQPLLPQPDWYLQHGAYKTPESVDDLNQMFFDMVQTNMGFALAELNVSSEYIKHSLQQIEDSTLSPSGYLSTKDLLTTLYNYLDRYTDNKPQLQLAFARLTQRMLLNAAKEKKTPHLLFTVDLLKIIYQWLPAFSFDRDDDLKLLKLAMKLTYQAQNPLENYVFVRKFLEILQLEKIHERQALHEPGMGSTPTEAVQFVMNTVAYDYHKSMRRYLPSVYKLLDHDYASRLGYLNTAMESLHFPYSPLVKLTVIAMIYTELAALQQCDMLPASFTLDGEHRTIIEWQDTLWHLFEDNRKKMQRTPDWDRFGDEIESYLDPVHLKISSFTKMCYFFYSVLPVITFFLFYKNGEQYLPQFFNQNYKKLLQQLTPLAKRHEFIVRQSRHGIELSRSISSKVNRPDFFNYENTIVSGRDTISSHPAMSLWVPQITLTCNDVRDAIAAWLHDSGYQRCVVNVAQENGERLRVAIFIPVSALPISLKHIDPTQLQIRVLQRSAEYIAAKRTVDARLQQMLVLQNLAASIAEYQKEMRDTVAQLRALLVEKQYYNDRAQEIIEQGYAAHVEKATRLLEHFTQLTSAIEQFAASDSISNLQKKLESFSQQQTIIAMQQQLFTVQNDVFLQDAWITVKTAKLPAEIMVSGIVQAVTEAMLQVAWGKFIAICHIDPAIVCRFLQIGTEYSVTVTIPFNSLVISFPMDFATQLTQLVHQDLKQRATEQQEQALYDQATKIIAVLPARAAAIMDLLPKRIADAATLASYHRKLDYYHGEIARYTTLVASGRRQAVLEQYTKIIVLPEELSGLRELINEYSLPVPEPLQRSSSTSATNSTTFDDARQVIPPNYPRPQSAVKLPLRATSDIVRPPLSLRAISDVEKRSGLQRAVSDTDRGSKLAYGYRDDIVAAFAALQQTNTSPFTNNLYALNDMLAQYNMYVQELARRNLCSAVYAKALNNARNTLRHSIHRYINGQYDSELLQRLQKFGHLLAGMEMQKQSAQQKTSLETYANFFNRELTKYLESPVPLELQVINLQETIMFLLAKASKDELSLSRRDRTYYAVISGCMAAIGQVMNELLRDLELKEFQDFFGNQPLLVMSRFSSMTCHEQRDFLSKLSLGSLLRLCRNFRAARGHDLDVDLVIDQQLPADFTPENVEDSVKLDLFQAIRNKAREAKLDDFFAPLQKIIALKQLKVAEGNSKELLHSTATQSNA